MLLADRQQWSDIPKCHWQYAGSGLMEKEMHPCLKHVKGHFMMRVIR
jgi:hypothetical protein